MHLKDDKVVFNQNDLLNFSTTVKATILCLPYLTHGKKGSTLLIAHTIKSIENLLDSNKNEDENFEVSFSVSLCSCWKNLILSEWDTKVPATKKGEFIPFYLFVSPALLFPLFRAVDAAGYKQEMLQESNKKNILGDISLN